MLEQTGGVGADLVVEVGGAGTLAQSLKAVRTGGVVAQIGVLTQTSEPMNIGPILHKQVRLQGIYVGSRRHFEEMNQGIIQNRMKPIVDEVFSFREAPEALRRMEAGAHFGKIAIRISE